VVPNAGFGDRGDYFDHLTADGDPLKPEFDCLKVTLIGQMYTVKLAMHYMRKQSPQGGAIVSTVSRSGYDCQSIPVYAASKHGMIGLMRGLRPHTPTWSKYPSLAANTFLSMKRGTDQSLLIKPKPTTRNRAVSYQVCLTKTTCLPACLLCLI
jgi:NADP-dependent 3-hydroxy acid dehydrogenase YdfG